jgi:hypothetical protein
MKVNQVNVNFRCNIILCCSKITPTYPLVISTVDSTMYFKRLINSYAILSIQDSLGVTVITYVTHIAPFVMHDDLFHHVSVASLPNSDLLRCTILERTSMDGSD